jgi:hypothetical protein
MELILSAAGGDDNGLKRLKPRYLSSGRQGMSDGDPSHRSVSWRSSPVRGRQSSGQLHRYDPERAEIITGKPDSWWNHHSSPLEPIRVAFVIAARVKSLPGYDWRAAFNLG